MNSGNLHREVEYNNKFDLPAILSKFYFSVVCRIYPVILKIDGSNVILKLRLICSRNICQIDWGLGYRICRFKKLSWSPCRPGKTSVLFNPHWGVRTSLIGAQYQSKTGAVFEKGLNTTQGLGLSLRNISEKSYRRLGSGVTFVRQKSSSKAWQMWLFKPLELTNNY